MTTLGKIIVLIVVLVVGAFAIAFGFSRYLVSKLDGTGGAVAPQEEFLQYSSEEGYSFMYPNTYELSSHTEGNAERQWDVLVFLPKGYVPPEAGEGPATIAVSSFPNPEGFDVETWVKGDARSNWKLTLDDRASTTTTVGGEPALWYHYSGLYETDAVAVAKGDRIFLFTVGYLGREDQVRKDFNALLKTVQWTND